MTRANEDYMRSIYALSGGVANSEVRSKDIAEFLGVSRAAVCVGMVELAEQGLIVRNTRRGINMTENGVILGAKLYHRYTVICSLYRCMGCEDSEFYPEICSLEHIISEVTVNRLEQFLISIGCRTDSPLSA